MTITDRSRRTAVETGGLPVMLDVDLGRGLLPGLSVDLHVDLRAYAKLNLRCLIRQGKAKGTRELQLPGLAHDFRYGYGLTERVPSRQYVDTSKLET